MKELLEEVLVLLKFFDQAGGEYHVDCRLRKVIERIERVCDVHQACVSGAYCLECESQANAEWEARGHNAALKKLDKIQALLHNERLGLGDDHPDPVLCELVGTISDVLDD